MDAGVAESTRVEMQSIVDELAQAIRRPITLEDAGGRLMAYSVHEQPVDNVRVETLLRRGASSVTLEALRARGVYRTVDSCEGLARVLPIPELGFSSRACLAIRGASRVLGYLWVVDPDSSLPKSAEGILLRARNRLSMELARRHTVLEASWEQRSRFLEDLCGHDHGGEGALARQAKALGWYHFPPMMVIVARGPAIAERLPGIMSDIEDVIHHHAAACLRGTLRGEVLFVLSGRECQSASALAFGLTSLLSQVDGSALVGAGGTCDSLTTVRRSYLEASSAISLGSKLMSSQRYFDYSTLAPYELLSCMAACKKAGSYGREPVERVVAYDKLHESNLFLTLEAFLDFYGRRKQAACRLNIHPNTLDYRIRKVRELTGLDFDEPNTRFVVHLWVKALSPRVRGQILRNR